MKNQFLFLLLGFIFILSLTSVSAYSWDNLVFKKGINQNTGYSNLEIKNALGLGETLFEGSLTENTNKCSGDCRSKIEFNHTGGAVIDDIEFRFIRDDGSYYIDDIDKYRFEYKVELPEHERKCVNGITYKNGTVQQICNEVLTGKTYRGFSEYSIGEELPAGNYEMYLYGNKKPSDNIDWVLTIQGKKLEDWAVWEGVDSTGLVGYWNLDETSGTTIYDYLGVSNGTNVGGAEVGRDGILGTAYYLNGVNAYLNLYQNASIKMSEDMTFNIWLNMTKAPAVETYVMSAGVNNYELSVSSARLLSYAVGGAGGPTGYTIPLNEWVMLTWTVNDAGYGLFVNGASYNSSDTTDLDGDANDLFIGARSPIANNQFNGTFDEVALWNRTLTTDEITSLYNGGAGNLPIRAGEVTLNSPADSSTTDTANTLFNATSEISGATLVNMSLWNDDGGWSQKNITTGLSGTTHTQTWYYSIPEGDTIWNVQTCDSDGDCGFATSNYTVSLDSTAPTIDILYPTSNIPTIADGQNTTLNYSISDTNLEACWYNYNGTNTTTPCAANSSFTYVQGENTLILYANDTIGNEGSATVSWSIDVQENSQTYDPTAIEFSEETFSINVTYNDTKFNVITGTLHYNGDSYLGSKSGSGDTVVFTRTITVPDVTAAENKSFHWRLALTNASGTYYYNQTTYNQTVSPINMSLCGSPHTVPFINFTVLDENTLNAVNGTFEGTFTYSGLGSTSSNTFSYSYTSNDTNEYDFCLDPSTENYDLDTTIEVGATGYVTKFYNWENLFVSNTTTEQNLYLLPTDDSTSFIIKVIDVGASPQVGYEVEVQRYQSGAGTWITTEILTTNYEGKAIGHLYTEDVNYRFLVSDAGVSIYISTSTTIACEETPCTVTLVLPSDIDSGFEELESLTTDLTYNSDTNIFTFTYQDDSSAFSSGQITVNKWNAGNATDNEQVCSSSSSSSTAVLTCDISAEVNGTYVAKGYIVRTDSGTTLVEIEYGVLGDSIYNRVGSEGVLWSFFLFIAIVMLGTIRPSLGILSAIMGVVALSFLQVINIGWTALIAVVAIGVVLLIQVKRE